MSKTYWRNSDGLKVPFGVTDKPYADNIAEMPSGAVFKKYIVSEFDYTALPARTSTDTGTAFIPAGSVITDAWIFVDQAWTGLTNLTIGFVRTDGTTEIDIDGVLTATKGAQAALTAGLVTRADGALVPYRYVAGGVGDPANDPLIPAPVVLGYDAYLEAYANGTATAGSMRVVIEYIPPYTSVIR